MADNIQGTGLVSEIANLQAIQAQADAIVSMMVKAFADISAASKDAANVTFNFNGLDKLQPLLDVIKRAEQATIQLTQAQSGLNDVSVQFNALSGTFGNGLRANAEVLANAKNEVALLTKELSALNALYNKGKIDEDAYAASAGHITERLQQAKVEVQQYTAAVNNQIKVTAQSNEGFRELNAEIAINKALNKEAATATNNAAQSFISQVGSIKALKAELKTLTFEYERMTAAQRVGTEGQALQKNIIKTKDEIVVLEGQIRKTTVTWDNFSQIFQRSGMRMAASFFWFTALIGTFQLAAEAIGDWWERLNYKQNASSAIAKELTNDFTNESVAIQTMRDRWNEAGTTMESKKQIVIELNDVVKDQYKAITSVTDAENFFKDKSEAFIKALTLRAEAQANLTALTKEYQKQVEMNADPQGELTFFNKVGAAVRAVGDKGKLSPMKNKNTLSEEYDWEKTAAAAGKTNMLLEESYKKQAIYVKNIIDLQNQAASVDSKNGFDTTDTKVIKDKKGANPSELPSLNRLTKDKYDEEKYSLQTSMENNRLIFEDDKKTLEERLGAYTDFYNNKRQLAEAKEREENEKMENLRNVSQSILDSPKSSAKQKQIAQNGIDLADSHAITAHQEYLNTIARIDKDYSQEYVQLLTDDEKRRLGIIENAAVKEQVELTMNYDKELRELTKALDDKKIKIKEYNQLRDMIQTQFNIKLLENQIKADDDELAQMDKTTAAYLSKLKDRDSKATQLTELKNGKANKPKNSEFGGDIIAEGWSSFIQATSPNVEDDERIKYAKKLSAMTTQLAQETANALKTIQDNQFAQQKQDLDRQAKVITRNAQYERDAALATTDYADVKAKKIAKINAQEQAMQSELAAKKYQLEQIGRAHV